MSDFAFAGAELTPEQKALVANEVNRSKTQVVFAPSADEPLLPNPWMRLPTDIAALVADPADWGAIAIHDQKEGNADDVWRMVVEAIHEGTLQVLTGLNPMPTLVLPTLTAKERPLPLWKYAAVERARADYGEVVAAGILQMGDHLTPSHEILQKLEDRQIANYWHLIHHRRESDYGNAKYWARRGYGGGVLGDLPGMFPLLAPGSEIEEVDEPLGFVDLVSEAYRKQDKELLRFVERLQWFEMIGLITHSLRDAAT